MLTLTPAYDLLAPNAGDAPGSAHGTSFDGWGRVAAALAVLYADAAGEPVDVSHVDAAASRVVNDGDGESVALDIWDADRETAREVLREDVLARALHARAVEVWGEEGGVTGRTILAALDAHAGVHLARDHADAIGARRQYLRTDGRMEVAVRWADGEITGSPSGVLLARYALSRVLADGEAIDAYCDLSDAVEAFLSAEVAS